MSNDDDQPQKAEFTIKKLNSFFVDEVANISISPNGACRLQFVSWQTAEDGKPVRVDSEVIMTIQSLKLLSESLPQAISQSEEIMQQRQSPPSTKSSLQ